MISLHIEFFFYQSHTTHSEYLFQYIVHNEYQIIKSELNK